MLVRDTVQPAAGGEERYVGLEHIGEGSLSLLGAGTSADVTSAKARFRRGDILFGKLRPYFRKVVRAPFDGICSTDIWVVRPTEGIDPGYLFYYMASQPFVDAATRGSTGTKMPRANWDFVSRLEVPVPPMDEQRAIAAVLGAFDDKIELNRRRSETLEGIARALFKSWFVDFDPVRAKAEGEDPGLHKPISDLFPDSFEDSPIGEIPAGWAVASLGAITEKPQYGYTASASDDPVGPRFLRITDINKTAWIDWRAVPYCDAGPSDRKKYLLRKGDIVIARMADPGHAAFIEEGPEAVFASYLIRFRPVDERFGRFLQYWLRSSAYWDLVRGRGAGTTRSTLNAQTLSRFPLVVPSGAVASEFARHVESLRDRLVVGMDESGVLSQLRDALLPRLMSGDLSLSQSRAVPVEVGS
ncbi:MAG: restriction endonuclease subunit S [Acidimicrobiia bacterium]